MKYFDAHTHVQFAAYNADRAEAILRAQEAGVGMNVVGTQIDTSRAAVAVAGQYDGVWATIGLHPVHTSKSYHDTKELGPSFAKASEGKEGREGFMSRGEVFDFAAYEALGQNPKVIAIGECGLDYYRVDESTKAVQVETFIQQIELANKLEKPLMLHIRNGAGEANAYLDALDLIKSHAKVRGDVHFFAGDWDIARRFLDLGFTLSFTGVITFTHDYDEVVRNTPLDMILSETDAPYITPVPFRGKRNESAYIPYVVEQIAKIRGEDTEAVRGQILKNARRVFNM
ncbi:TatD family hydrolase [Candidatus Kaiserbacteria bacterium]|nr:TatD family hydrolase [Candidatus Kaiserbacteria bacterium]